MLCRPDLLLPGAPAALSSALADYPPFYDEVFDAVHQRLEANGHATKLDLGALIAWKHVQNSPWMKDLQRRADDEVRDTTGTAFRPGLSDAERVDVLRALPGFRRAGAFTSVLFTAWDPDHYGVFDRIVNVKYSVAVTPDCACDRADLPTFWAHLRAIAAQLTTDEQKWTPRMVDMALFNLT